MQISEKISVHCPRLVSNENISSLLLVSDVVGGYPKITGGFSDDAEDRGGLLNGILR
jgi:hypothetical protein